MFSNSSQNGLHRNRFFLTLYLASSCPPAVHMIAATKIDSKSLGPMLWEIFANCWGIHPQTCMWALQMCQLTRQIYLTISPLRQPGLGKQLQGSSVWPLQGTQGVRNSGVWFAIAQRAFDREDHRIDRVLSFLSCRPNWDSLHPLTRRRVL